MGVPFCRMGLDVCACCWVLVCVLEWVAEEVPVAAVDVVCMVEVLLVAPLFGCPPPDGEGLRGWAPFCPTRGIGGRWGVSC